MATFIMTHYFLYKKGFYSSFHFWLTVIFVGGGGGWIKINAVPPLVFLQPGLGISIAWRQWACRAAALLINQSPCSPNGVHSSLCYPSLIVSIHTVRELALLNCVILFTSYTSAWTVLLLLSLWPPGKAIKVPLIYLNLINDVLRIFFIFSLCKKTICSSSLSSSG